MAFSRLQLHEVNVTAVRGSVNVCVCVFAAGRKAAPNVHLWSSQST